MSHFSQMSLILILEKVFVFKSSLKAAAKARFVMFESDVKSPPTNLI